jgi:hypothetical protein
MISKKRFGIGMLFLAMLLVSIVLVSAASAAADKEIVKNPSDSKGETYNIKDLTPEKAKEIEAEVSRNNNMPATVKNCPYAGLLVANDEQKKVFLGYIDKLSVSDSEKKEMKNALQDIWSRVPNGVTEKDYPVMKKIGKAITDYVEETYWKGKQSVQWMSNTHQNLIGAGVVLVYNNGNYASWARTAAMLPDSTIDSGYISVSLLGKTISIPKTCYYHYYNPTAAYGLGFGGAPSKCSSYAATAKSYYQKKDYSNAFKNLGIASHYLSDVAQPMHSGGESGSLIDYLLNWNGNYYHYQYEQYVENNWVNGVGFSKNVVNNKAIKSVTNPSSAVKSMASYSNGYSTTLWAAIYANPSFDTRYTGTVNWITANTLTEAAKYNAGLAKYIKS